jgi:hypothetical protein
MKTKLKIAGFILACFLAASGVSAQSCPRNLFDCPGLCGWFVDTNQDGYCDLSLFSEPVLSGFKKKNDSLARIASKKRLADSLAAISKPGEGIHNSELLAQNIPPANKEKNPDAESATANHPDAKHSGSAQTTADAGSAPSGVLKKPIKRTYDFFLIFGGCLVLYLLTYILSRRKVIKKVTHRKIWNVMLLLTFLPSAIIGLLLAIQANYGLFLGAFAELLFWHVQFAIAMAAISIFHILWHLKYWSMLLSKNGKRPDCP